MIMFFKNTEKITCLKLLNGKVCSLLLHYFFFIIIIIRQQQ